MNYKVLSNKGGVEYSGGNLELATEICLALNTKYQNTSEYFSVVEITPYRLLIDLAEAELWSSFPYEIVGIAWAAYYLSLQDYWNQLNNPDAFWHIKTKIGYITGTFDDRWYEEYDENN